MRHNQVQARATENHLTTARQVAVLQTEMIALTAKGRRNTNPKITKTRNLSIPKRRTRNLRRHPKKAAKQKETSRSQGGMSNPRRTYLGRLPSQSKQGSYDPPKAHLKNNVRCQNINYQGQTPRTTIKISKTATIISAKIRFRILANRVNATIT